MIDSRDPCAIDGPQRCRFAPPEMPGQHQSQQRPPLTDRCVPFLLTALVLLSGQHVAAQVQNQSPAVAATTAVQSPPPQGGAQRPEPIPDTDYAPTEALPEPKTPAIRPATAFAMPDVPDRWNTFTAYDGPAFSTRLSLVMLVDFTAFSQDDDSVDQVGRQESQWDLRTARIMDSGRLKFAHPLDYGLTGLDRFGVSGLTHALHTRLQWIY